MAAPEGPREFPATRWTQVRRALAGDEKESGCAMGELCRDYWYPLYAYVRRSGQNPDEAEDLVQSFFLTLLAKKYLEDANPAKGRLRTFLLTALKRFMANDWRNRNTLKRGGGVEMVSIDVDEAEELYRHEPADFANPEDLYEHRWVLALLQGAVDRLRLSYAERGRADAFDLMRDFLDDDGQAGYADLGKQMGVTENTARAAVFRLRQQYRLALQDAIRETLDDPSDSSLQEELGYLKDVLSRQGRSSA
ncbi:MAG: sigma-70 family RNA polymerase sigma factor [Verrucomicrobiales bacterium]|nr:sigma-70 family RNA polymerase sigma factor [Verrucomicrobiales bacterium]